MFHSQSLTGCLLCFKADDGGSVSVTMSVHLQSWAVWVEFRSTPKTQIYIYKKNSAQFKIKKHIPQQEHPQLNCGTDKREVTGLGA